VFALGRERRARDTRVVGLDKLDPRVRGLDKLDPRVSD
jgi:hypothetical protein